MPLSEIKWRVFLRSFARALIDPPFLMISKGGVNIYLLRGSAYYKGELFKEDPDEDGASSREMKEKGRSDAWGAVHISLRGSNEYNNSFYSFILYLYSLYTHRKIV